MNTKPAPLIVYGIVVLLVVCTVIVRLSLNAVLPIDTPFLLFLVPVILSTYWGGFAPGLFATLLSGLVSSALFLSSGGSLLNLDWSHTLPLGLFLAEGGLLTWFGTKLQTAKRQTKVSQAQAKQYQNQLSDSEQQFRSLVEEINDYAIFMLDINGKIETWNKGAEHIKGYQANEILGQNFSCFYPPEDIQNDKPKRALQIARVQGRYEDEGWRIRKDGSRFWANVIINALHDETGNLRGFANVTRDITDRRQAAEVLNQSKDELEMRVAERTAELVGVNQRLQMELDERKQIESALRVSQARFAGILEIADDAIISIDANQKITLFNQGAERIFGYAAQDVIGQPLDLLLPTRIAQAHQQHVNEFDRTAAKARRMAERREIFGRRCDGTEFPAEASISKLALGTEKILTVILRDVSERKRSEQALQDVLQRLNFHVENSPLAVIEWDPLLRVSRWSLAAERMFGWQAEEVLGKNASEWQFIFQEDVEAANQMMARLGSGLEQRNVSLNRNHRKDGSILYCEWYNSVLLDTAGNMVSLLSLVQDVTDRQQIERMKDEFVSVVSHELRTPLTSIHGSLGMLASGLLDADSETGKRLLHIAVDSTERLVRLVNDILDIERIETHKVTMAKQPCIVADLMTRAIDTMQAFAEKSEVILSVTTIPAQITVDPDRIIQVLTNLLSNAIKFSPKGATIWLSAACQEDQVLFQVKDQGRGIPADRLESIFERFQQVDASDSRNHDGTGLGLAICRSIVHQHEGKIWVESQLGQGSTFYFTLPSSHCEPPAAGDPQ